MSHLWHHAAYRPPHAPYYPHSLMAAMSHLWHHTAYRPPHAPYYPHSLMAVVMPMVKRSLRLLLEDIPVVSKQVSK